MSRSAAAPSAPSGPSAPSARPAPPAVSDRAQPLVVSGLSKTFTSGFALPWGRRTRRRVRAVEDVSFEVPRRAIFGLIGANGSGKSTLIRILSSLVLADRGEVKVFGYDIERSSMEARQLINRV